MINARLINDLEKFGFKIDFPSYNSNDEKIIEILKSGNERLNLAIPLLLRNNFNYKSIINKLDKKEIEEFNKIILISSKIFISEKIDNKTLEEIIKKNKIMINIDKNEFLYYYNSFKEFEKNEEQNNEENLNEQINFRKQLSKNEALQNIFAPAKIRIMKKIFNHETLTNTELKYYYKAIKPLIISILNEDMQNYLSVVGDTKKYSDK